MARARPEGYVTGAQRLGELVTGALGDVDIAALDLRLVDASAAPADVEVPFLNAGEDWAHALAAIVRRSCAWLDQPETRAEIASASAITARTSASLT